MKKKWFISLGLMSVLALGMVTLGAAAGPKNASARYDFTANDSGFIPIFADYPDQENVNELYDLQHSYGEIPISGAGKGLYISGNNQSADLFMGYVKELDGLSPGVSYQFKIQFKLATNVEGGLVGVGGAPGESVYVKCGVTPIRPQIEINDIGYFQLNIDKGNQSQSGTDMITIGDITKTENNCPGEYEFKNFQATMSVTANKDGCVYLIIGTDSGFEAATSYYLDDIDISWS